MVTGGYSGLQVTGMTEWGKKSTPPNNNLFIEKQKTSLDQKLAPPRNPMPICRALKVFRKQNTVL